MNKLHIVKILNFLKAQDRKIFITWQENSGLNGSYAKIMSANDNGVLISFEHLDTAPSMDAGKKVLIRTSMLLRPLMGVVGSKDKNLLSINDVNAIQIDREKRRYLRINLSEPLEATILISNMFFQSNIVDISEGGAGIIINTSKPMEVFQHKQADIQFRMFGSIMKIKVRFAWVSKTNLEQYFAGIEFLAETFQKNIIQKFIIDNMYSIEEDMLRFIETL